MMNHDLIKKIGADNDFGFLYGKLLSSRVYPEFFKLKNTEKVVNIGCGMGPQAIVYHPNYKKMVGVDINIGRIEKSKKMMETIGIENYTPGFGNVEKLSFNDISFDKALAIDIIEHVQNPEKMCREINNVLKEGGELLITFPAMHDKFVNFVSLIGRTFFRKKKKEIKAEWNPDDHNHENSLSDWIKIVESCGFKLKKSRSTTMFPPLHLYGVKRFWYGNEFIHGIDSFFCNLPFVKNFGQTLLCIFEKK
jgi:cyclopropane fatty-acyl-phospholipid synthase-like methyltransferase